MLPLVLHFVFTQCRPILLIYAGVRTYLKDVVVYDLTSTTWGTSQEILHRSVHMENLTMDRSLQDFLECTRDDAEDSLYSTSSGNYTGRCSTIPESTHKVDMALNYALLIGCVSMVLVLVLLLIHSGIKDIGEGRYLAWTKGMSNKPCYKLMSRVLLFLVFLMLGRHVYSIYQEAMKGEFRQVVLFLELYATQILVLTYSAVKLMESTATPFNEDTELFQDLQFKRGWSSVFTEANTDFASTLVTALYKAKSGFKKDLLDLIDGDSCSTLDDVFQACAPAEYDSLDNDDDTEDDSKT